MEKKNNPIQLKVMRGDKAWMYVDPKSIEIYIHQKGKDSLSCRITEKQLLKLLSPKH